VFAFLGTHATSWFPQKSNQKTPRLKLLQQRITILTFCKIFDATFFVTVWILHPFIRNEQRLCYIVCRGVRCGTRFVQSPAVAERQRMPVTVGWTRPLEYFQSLSQKGFESVPSLAGIFVVCGGLCEKPH
jgi:hypothetical protein